MPRKKTEISTAQTIDSILARNTASFDVGPMERTLIKGRLVTELRAALTKEVLADILSLQNTMLGFQTDKPEGGYSLEVVRDCLIDGLMSGVLPIGNEFNIIAGRPYITVNGWRRLVQEWPGVTELRLQFGQPALSKDGVKALVEAVAVWKLEGERQELRLENGEIDSRLSIRVNRRMGDDGILGKAESKLLKKVYRVLAGVHAAAVALPDVPTQGAASMRSAGVPELLSGSDGPERLELAGWLALLAEAKTRGDVEAIGERIRDELPRGSELRAELTEPYKMKLGEFDG